MDIRLLFLRHLLAMVAACIALSAPAAAQDEGAAAEATEEAAGESRVVGGRIQLGLHATSRFDSEVIALLPTGTPLRLLERVNGLARVRDEAGREGWVDASFLVEALAPEEAAAASAAHTEALDELRARLDALGAERAELMAERDELAARLERSAADNERETLQPADIEPASAEDSARLAALRDENARLAARVSELDGGAPKTAFARLMDPDRAPAPWRIMRAWGLWMYVFLASAALLAFCCGAALVRWDVRRRHGGFRV